MGGLIFKPIKIIFLFIFRHIILKLYKPYLYLKKSLSDHSQGLAIFRKYIDGTTIVVIFTITLAYNFQTKDTLAEDLGKTSLLKQVITTEFETEIVETIVDQVDTSTPASNVATQELPIKSGAVQIKDTPRPITSDSLTNQNGLAGNTGALVKPNLTGPEATSTRSEIAYYEVQTGDNIGFIAEQFGLRQSTILWANNLSDRSLIKPGDKLTILPVDGVYHQVARGDTVSKIAKKYSASEDDIIDYNMLADSTLTIGQKLIIPGGKVTYSIPTPTGLGSIRNVLTGSPQTTSAKGFVWPSSSRRITQYYSWRHTGLDIGASTGTPIIASKAGRIITSGWNAGGYGYYIIIDHGGGIQTLYAHASQLYVKRGDQVQAGQTIGAVGSTGRSTGPHIHYELRINGAKVNPLSYL